MSSRTRLLLGLPWPLLALVRCRVSHSARVVMNCILRFNTHCLIHHCLCRIAGGIGFDVAELLSHSEQQHSSTNVDDYIKEFDFVDLQWHNATRAVLQHIQFSSTFSLIESLSSSSSCTSRISICTDGASTRSTECAAASTASNPSFHSRRARFTSCSEKLPRS